ncbi:MAG TPA: glycosyltransferase family 2 protein [Saprospiraceae bacterium]|nr:glycosyltransferase family 2 protein [Saprospiraceae bacterium]
MIIDVIIPAYNEEHGVEKVIDNLPKYLIREVIVCNNGSTDATADRAAHAGATVVHVQRQGYGAACLAGITYLKSKAQNTQPDIVVFIDADYSDFPEELPSLIDPILYHGYEIVIGCRTQGKAGKGSLTPQQVLGNRLASHLIRMIYGYRFSDLGPFRAIRWETLLRLDMQDKNYGWTVEMQVKAAKLQLRYTEVPVSYRKRIGRSKVSGTLKGSILAGYKILWTIFKLI